MADCVQECRPDAFRLITHPSKPWVLIWSPYFIDILNLADKPISVIDSFRSDFVLSGVAWSMAHPNQVILADVDGLRFRNVCDNSIVASKTLQIPSKVSGEEFTFHHEILQIPKVNVYALINQEGLWSWYGLTGRSSLVCGDCGESRLDAQLLATPIPNTSRCVVVLQKRGSRKPSFHELEFVPGRREQVLRWALTTSRLKRRT